MPPPKDVQIICQGCQASRCVLVTAYLSLWGCNIATSVCSVPIITALPGGCLENSFLLERRGEEVSGMDKERPGVQGGGAKERRPPPGVQEGFRADGH